MMPLASIVQPVDPREPVELAIEACDSADAVLLYDGQMERIPGRETRIAEDDASGRRRRLDAKRRYYLTYFITACESTSTSAP